MRVLITGITGMAGSHLAEYLLAREDCQVHGTLRWRSNRRHIAGIESQTTLHDCELRDPHAVMRVLDTVRPAQIYHLASQSSVAASWNSPRDTLVNNITAELNLFESVRHLNLNATRILIAGSSEAYGLVYPDELPVSEDNPLRPLSPYGVSKVAQDTLAFQYYQSYNLHLVRTRAFNHFGPRQEPAFVTAGFAKQIVEIENRRREPVIHVGNLEARRDFTDIRDVVRAYVLALEQGDAGAVYNIGADEAHSIHQVLELLLDMSNIVIEVKPDPRRVRPSDVPVMLCDSRRFRQCTGWQPSIPFEQTLADLLHYWRGRLRQRPSEHDSELEIKPALPLRSQSTIH